MTRKNCIEPVSTTRKNQFELVTASFNYKNKHSFNNEKKKQVWARKNQYELDTASFNDKEQPVWASHSQFQTTFTCYAQQPVTSSLS